MFVQTEVTPNPNSLKFLPGKTVSKNGSFEVTKKNEVQNDLINNLLSIRGVESIFLGKDFISINKLKDISWDEIKHIVISLINDFYFTGKECIIGNDLKEDEVFDGRPHDSIEAYGFNKRVHLVFNKALQKQYGIESNQLALANLYGEGDVFDEERSHVIS